MIHPTPATPAGIYVHWPFCEQKCPYCDFYTFGREHPNSRFGQLYLQQLLKEIDDFAPDSRARARARNRNRMNSPPDHPTADTIYFGGGTPSLMGPAALSEVLTELNKKFVLNENSEITLEINPTTAETAQLDRLLALGVNRLSVGSQSFNDRILQQLGRVHDAATTRRAIALMREAGAQNISLDLIFATPTQTLDDLRSDLDEILRFSPEHISIYGMTIHRGTPFARWQAEGRLPLPPEDDYAVMYELILDTLAAAGYEHYEISNWSRPGHRSRHNFKYWQDADIAAFGVSAHGVWNGDRTENTRDLKGYLQRDPAALHKLIDPPATPRAAHGEIMMLALRRVQGVLRHEINTWADADLRDYYASELDTLNSSGLIEYDATSIRLTRRGLLLADTVSSEFF